MDTNTLKDLMYGGVVALMKNRTLYYNSALGPEYSNWTPQGAKALEEYLNYIGYQILKEEAKELDSRAKDLVIKGLKGD